MLIWADGFDHWGSRATALSVYTSFPELEGPLARTGPACASIQGNSLRRAVPLADEYIVGAAIRETRMGATAQMGYTQFITFECGGVAFTVSPDGNYGFSIGRYGQPDFGSTAPNLWSLDQWFYLEARMKVGGVGVAIFEVRLNGNVIFARNDINISNGQISGIYASEGLNGFRFYLDDFYILDTTGPENNTFLGDRRMRTLLVQTDDAPQEWVSSTGGSAAAILDNVPPTADYIAADGAGDVSKFGLGEQLPFNTSDIAGVVVFGRTMKSDSGSAAVSLGIENANGVVTATEIEPLITAEVRERVFQKGPGNLPWTKPTLDNAKLVLTRTV